MQVARLLIPLACLISACAPDPAAAPPAPSPSSNALRLTAAQKSTIGKKIWQNESAGKVSGLTAWNAGEEFPSMGIGHFIWYPKGFNGRWTESFPEFVRFANRKGTNPPSVAKLPDCPWNSRSEFQANFNGPQLVGLRNWLAANISIQTEFIAYKSRAALPKILQAAPSSQRARIEANYHKVASTPNGVYALVDYVNFKGDGTNPRETYAGQGWGLMWVLMDMAPTPGGQASAREFSAAAKRRLDLRIKNSPPARGETRWRTGWHNRCNTYARAF